MRVEGADEDVQVGRVVGDLRFGAESGLLSFGRLPLLETGDRRRLAPDAIIILSVDHRSGRGTNGDGIAVGRRPDAKRSGGPRLATCGRLLRDLKTQGESKECG